MIMETRLKEIFIQDIKAIPNNEHFNDEINYFSYILTIIKYVLISLSFREIFFYRITRKYYLKKSVLKY